MLLDLPTVHRLMDEGAVDGGLSSEVEGVEGIDDGDQPGADAGHAVWAARLDPHDRRRAASSSMATAFRIAALRWVTAD